MTRNNCNILRSEITGIQDTDLDLDLDLNLDLDLDLPDWSRLVLRSTSKNLRSEIYRFRGEVCGIK